jgi:isochorismate pyruvate lyase
MDTTKYKTMAALRQRIDQVDAELVALLATRARLIERAIEIKQPIGMPARIDIRVEDVVAKVKAEALVQGLDPDLAEKIWRMMVEHFIAHEEMTLGKG